MGLFLHEKCKLRKYYGCSLNKDKNCMWKRLGQIDTRVINIYETNEESTLFWLREYFKAPTCVQQLKTLLANKLTGFANIWFIDWWVKFVGFSILNSKHNFCWYKPLFWLLINTIYSRDLFIRTVSYIETISCSDADGICYYNKTVTCFSFLLSEVTFHFNNRIITTSSAYTDTKYHW